MNITIPPQLLPADARFGSGPTRVRADQVQALAAANPRVLGTSHRQPPVKDLVGEVRSLLLELFSAPDGYEVILGNGGASLFWDAATFHLIHRHAQFAESGEFGAKFAAAAKQAPWLEEPEVIEDKYLPNSETWVACQGNKSLGFISLLDKFVGGIFVAPGQQGKGVGRQLIAFALERKRELTLEVYTQNEQAIRFYTSLGFREISRRPYDDEGLPFENARLTLST